MRMWEDRRRTAMNMGRSRTGVIMLPHDNHQRKTACPAVPAEWIGFERMWRGRRAKSRGVRGGGRVRNIILGVRI